MLHSRLFYLWLATFAAAYTQPPLYSFNQNTYFLHGLANAKVGFLKADWLANTSDPFPVFSALVTLTISCLPETTFYVYYALLLSLYAYTLTGIASQLYSFLLPQRLTFLTIFTFLHAAVFGYSSEYLIGLNGSWLLQSGVAGQYLLGPVLQPSTFGVFLILSLYWFLQNRLYAAMLALSFAATMHSSYLLSAGILTVTYLLIRFRQMPFLKLFRLGILALVLLLPTLSYTYLYFIQTTSLSLAQTILAKEVFPYHALPKYWLDSSAIFKIAMVLVALVLTLKKTRIFIVILATLGSATLLTYLQILTASTSLALLFPWRLSVLLVPLALAIILGKVVTFLPPVAQKPQLVLMGLLFISGLVFTAIRFHLAENDPSVPLMKFVKTTATENTLYLIPPELERFRLSTGVPILVDEKSHPYRAPEVIEWYQRRQTANQFYTATTPHQACQSLQALARQFHLTHVVLKVTQPPCEILHTLLYQDSHYQLYSIK